MEIMLAKSLSGHDAGRVYFIAGEEGGRLLLADGLVRTLEKPKKKNPLHVQKIKKLPDEVVRMLEKDRLRDEDIKRAIKIYTEGDGCQNQT